MSATSNDCHPESLEKIKVPILIRGLTNPGKVKIGFEIKVGIYSALLRWTRRMSLV